MNRVHMLESAGRAKSATYFMKEKYPGQTVITTEIAADLIANCDLHNISVMFQNNPEVKFENIEAMILLCSVHNILDVIFENHQDELDLYLKAITDNFPGVRANIFDTYLTHQKYDKKMLDTIMKYVTFDNEKHYYHIYNKFEDLFVLGYDYIIKYLEPNVDLAKMLKKYDYDLNRLNFKNRRYHPGDLIIYLDNEDYDFQPIFECVDKSENIVNCSNEELRILIKKGFNINKVKHVTDILRCNNPEKISLCLDLGMDPKIFLDEIPVNEQWKNLNNKLEAHGLNYSDIIIRTPERIPQIGFYDVNSSNIIQE